MTGHGVSCDDARMRTKRLKTMDGGWYHLTSRCVLKQFLFGDGDKAVFVRMMRRCAEFCGIDVLAYCVMSNHFHLLVRVPSPGVVPEGGVLRRVGVLYGEAKAEETRRRWEALRETGCETAVERELAVLRARMGDVSPFMKILKQRYSVWYRANHGRLPGTLWQGRFGSTVVEGCASALSAVAAYIDLNPVRAGIVADPAGYRWSGFGAASAGDRAALEGLSETLGGETGGADVLAKYRGMLSTKAGGGPEEMGEALAGRGDIPENGMLLYRIRPFTAGVVVGTKGFVEARMAEFRDVFREGRKTGAARFPRCPAWRGARLCSARKLRVRAVSVPDRSQPQPVALA